MVEEQPQARPRAIRNPQSAIRNPATLCLLLLLLAVAGCRRGGAPAAQGMPATPAALTQAGPSARFTDVARDAGITWRRENGAFGKKWFPETMGGGCAFLDYDHDGYLDILLVNGDWWPGHIGKGPRPTLALYRNLRNGRFADVTAQAGLAVPMQGMGVAVGDYDNDGWDDLCITGVGGNRLFHNEAGPNGTRRFRDVTAASGVAGSGWSTSAAWLDYDHDGRLDLFVCHYVTWSPATDQFCGGRQKVYCTPVFYQGESCRLYHNDGGGRFHDATAKAGLLNDGAKALGICAVDLDGDGWTDLVIANDQEPNLVYHNNGNGTFRDISLASGLALADDGTARAGMGIDAADIRNDGAPALLIGNFVNQGAGLYRRRPAGDFADDAARAGILRPTAPCVTFGAAFADFDLDGWKDAVLTNGHVDDLIETTSPGTRYAEPNLLFMNARGGAFRDATEQAGDGIRQPMVGRGLAVGDYDNDGRPDILLVPNIGAPRLLHNDTAPAGHWIGMELVGVKSNRDAYGTRVRITAGGATQSDEVRSGGSYLSQSDRRLLFGLGTATSADRVELAWPSGRRDVWQGLAAGRRYRAVEGRAPQPLP